MNLLTYDEHDYHGGEHDRIALIKRVLFNPIVEED
jgi:ABC-type iron transport system FetAB ATPase subunit